MTTQRKTTISVVEEIAAERLRQILEENWAPEMDDRHTAGELAQAAACYALHVNDGSFYPAGDPPQGWPWDATWWKPKNPRRDLIRAAALIVAEIERQDRAGANLKPCPFCGGPAFLNRNGHYITCGSTIHLCPGKSITCPDGHRWNRRA